MNTYPGSNILGLANRVIAQQTLGYRRFISRALNVEGVYQTTRSGGTSVRGNIQPVPRSRYEQNGLDFQKNYVNIFLKKNVTDIERNVTGDQFWYAGHIYQAESKTDWFAQDGWDQVLCVEVTTCSPPFPENEVVETDA